MVPNKRLIGFFVWGAFFLFLSVWVRAGEVMVFAAASLTDSLQEIGKAYEKIHPDEKIIFNFGGSNVLIRQIEAGAPADIFFSADTAKMDELQKKGFLLKDTHRDILSNSLVVIVEKAVGAEIPDLSALIGPKIQKLSLADTRGVPCGIYAQKYFEKMGVWGQVKDRVVQAENVRAALAAVESGDADAGVVFKTDAAISTKVKIAYEIPTGDVPKIAYPAGVLKDSKVLGEAKDFLAYLEAKEGLAVFKKYGFVTLVNP